MRRNRTTDEILAEIEEHRRLKAQGLDPRDGAYRLSDPTTRLLQIAVLYAKRAGADESWSRTGERRPRLALVDATCSDDEQTTNHLVFYAPGEMFEGEPSLASFAVY